MSETTVTIDFAPKLSSTAKIIEITNDFAKSLENGDPVFLKGTATDEAVLCTSNKTFALKRVEQSNAVCLFHEVKNSSVWTLRAMVKDFFEIIPADGKVHTIPSLLTHCTDAAYSYADTVRYMQEHVMASDEEIARALQTHNVVNNQGRLTVLTFQQIVELYEVLFPAIVTHDINLQSISEMQLASLLPQYPRAVLHFILNKLVNKETIPECLSFKEEVGLKTEDQDIIWSLNAEIVAKCLVHVIFLRATSLPWEEIQSELLARHPTVTDKEFFSPATLLPGIAVEVPVVSNSTIKGSSATNKIVKYSYYPVEMAPVDLQHCLKELFAFKKDYTLPELEPYVRRYMPFGKTNVVEWLLPYTRVHEGIYRSKE